MLPEVAVERLHQRDKELLVLFNYTAARKTLENVEIVQLAVSRCDLVFTQNLKPNVSRFKSNWTAPPSEHSGDIVQALWSHVVFCLDVVFLHFSAWLRWNSFRL